MRHPRRCQGHHSRDRNPGSRNDPLVTHHVPVAGNPAEVVRCSLHGFPGCALGFTTHVLEEDLECIAIRPALWRDPSAANGVLECKVIPVEANRKIAPRRIHICGQICCCCAKLRQWNMVGLPKQGKGPQADEVPKRIDLAERDSRSIQKVRRLERPGLLPVMEHPCGNACDCGNLLSCERHNDGHGRELRRQYHTHLDSDHTSSGLGFVKTLYWRHVERRMTVRLTMRLCVRRWVATPSSRHGW